MAHRRYRVRHHGRHHARNPFGIDRSALTTIGWGTVGAVGARALPAMFMSTQNTGLMGYGLNALSAVVLKFAGDAVMGKGVGDALFIGGGIATVMRIVQDNLGTKIVGLSGDAGFNLGAYWQSYFAVPTVSDPNGRVLASPYPQPVLAKAAGMGRYNDDRFGRRR